LLYGLLFKLNPFVISGVFGHDNCCRLFRWQQEQFRRRYSEIDVLGRGRFSVVRQARDRGTGQLVAAKQVSRSRQPLRVTQAEYSLLARLQHPNVARALALFESSPLPEIDTIVMEL